MNALMFSRWGNGIVDFEIFLTMFGWMACDSKRSGHRLARLCYSRWPHAPGLLSDLSMCTRRVRASTHVRKLAERDTAFQ